MAENTVKLVFKNDPGVIAWPCTISVPVSGGGHQEQQLTARFKVISSERFDELAGTALSRLTAPDGATKQGDVPLLAEVLVGFNDLQNEAGQSVSDDVAIPVMLAQPYAVAGLVRGYMEMLGLRTTKN